MNFEEVAEEIIAELNRISGEYCRECSYDCCSTKNMTIRIEESELEIFVENSIPIFKFEQLDTRSLEDWILKQSDYKSSEDSIPDKDILTTDGAVVPRPALIQGANDAENNRYIFYTEDGFCPLYDQEIRECSEHDNPKRPKKCRAYPLKIKGKDDILFVELGNPNESNCRLNSQPVLERLKEKFPEPQHCMKFSEPQYAIRLDWQ